MTILSTGRVTPQRAAVLAVLNVASGVLIYSGSIVVLNAGGYAAPGSAASGLRMMGRAEQTVDNTEGLDGDLRVRVRRSGAFLWANTPGADHIDLSDLNQQCFILDDQTVAKTSGGGSRSPAGMVAGLDTAGVWVEIPGTSSAASPVSPVSVAGGARKILVNRTDNPMVGAAAVLDLPDPPAGQEWIYLDFRMLFRFSPGGNSGFSSGLWIKDGAEVGSVAEMFGGQDGLQWDQDHENGLAPGHTTWTVGVAGNAAGQELYKLDYDPGNNRLAFVEEEAGTLEPTVVRLLVWGVSG